MEYVLASMGRPVIGAGDVPRFDFTTDHLPASERFASWREVVAPLFECAPPRRSAGPFSATLSVFHLGGCLLCHSRIEAGRYRRRAERLAWDDLDHLMLVLPLTGTARVGRAVLGPWDVGVLDLSAPTHLQLEGCESVSLILPRAALPAPVAGPFPRQGRVVAGGSALGAVLGHTLAGLAKAAPALGLHEAAALTLELTRLAAACLGDGSPDDPKGRIETPGDLGRRLRAHIEANLQREDLGPDVLAAELHLSRSQLYRHFEAVGGVARYVRQRRLRRCFLALCSPVHASQRIGDIAYDMGFQDEAHFSRLFHQTFGLSPRAVRKAARHGDGAALAGLVPSTPTEGRLAGWLASLAR